MDKLFVVGDYDDRFTIARGGNVGIGTTNPTYQLQVNGRIKSIGINETSDARLKTNVIEIQNALADVLKMRGVTYDWDTINHPDMNFEDGKQYGLIAQELEKVIPELVGTDKEGWKSIEYSHLVPVLVEAIKQQQAIIDKQKDGMDKLNQALNSQNEKVKAQAEKLDAQGKEIETIKMSLRSLEDATKTSEKE